MGAGASAHTTPSALNRLRKALVMRAYNVRTADDTLEELFRPHACRCPGGVFISIEAIKGALSEDAPWVDLLFEKMIGKEGGEVEFHSFIQFLETGKKPKFLDASQQVSGKSSLPNKHNLKVRPPTDLPPSKRKGNLPPTPPRYRTPTSQSSSKRDISKYIPKFNMATSTMYPGVIDSLGMHTLAIGIHSGAVVPSGGLAIALDNKSSYRNPNSGPTRPLWRKREVVKQERTIEYTTIDADGVTQELTEKEVTTTEVLHMECRETGEFAHRETTNYEQCEVFNDELVAEEKGNEEYVHMKSVDDEYEFLDSNMPKKDTPPEQQDTGTPHTPFTPGGGGGYDGSFQQSPTRIAEEKGPVRDTPMHDLSVSDDEQDQRYGRMQDCSPDVRNRGPNSPDASNNFRNGKGGKNNFEDSSYEDSPDGRGLWQSMGGNATWIPPQNTDYESELLNDEYEKQMNDSRPPPGVRRPDLFAPANEEKEHSKSPINNDDDINSVEGQTCEDGLDSRSQSSEERESIQNDSGRHSSRPTSRRGSSQPSLDGQRFPNNNADLNATGETLQSNMFRSDSYDQADHSSMFRPDPPNDQNIMFTDNNNATTISAKWGSEDDID